MTEQMNTQGGEMGKGDQKGHEHHTHDYGDGHPHGQGQEHAHDHIHQGHGHRGHAHSHGHETEDKWADFDYDAMPVVKQFTETSYNGIVSSLRAIFSDEDDLKSQNACDVGAAGTGLVTQHMQTFFKSIHAIDTSPSMLKRLSARFPDGGSVTYSLLSLSPQSTQLLQSGEPLPAPTKDDEKRTITPPRTSFDVVYGSLMLHHVEDLDGFFVGLKGIVKPGGWVVFSEFGSAEEDKEAVREAEKYAPIKSQISFPGADDQDGTVNQPGHHHQVWSKQTITELFQLYGFSEITVDFKGRLRWDANQSIPLMVVRARRSH